MKQIKFYIGLTVVLASIIFGGCNRNDNRIVSLSERSYEQSSDETKGTASAETSPTQIFVYVTGAVKNPGVYSLDDNARVYEAIEMAGGMTETAQKDYLNLADKIYDGQQIQVLTKKEFKAQKKALSESTGAAESGLISGTGTSGQETGDSSEGKVNINVATTEELTSLPGIGNTKAQAIVTYREQNGRFSSVEDIKNVSGIGDATFVNIESMITVD